MLANSRQLGVGRAGKGEASALAGNIFEFKTFWKSKSRGGPDLASIVFYFEIFPNWTHAHLCFLVLVFFGVFLRPVDKISVLPRKRIYNTKKIEGDNITRRLAAVWAEI